MRPIDADMLKQKYAKWYNVYSSEKSIRAVTTTEIDWMPTLSEWINVKDKLPEEGQLVVVRYEVKGQIYSEVAYYLLGRWWLDGISNGLELNAISWISIPEPPDEV